MQPHSIYIHIPFCQHRCGYCDFNTYAGQGSLLPAYVTALCREIESITCEFPERIPVHTVYFGGGTPSLLTTSQVQQILVTLQAQFELTSTPEISLEANPGTVTLESLSGYREAGINRLSLGAQSFNPKELRLMERIHTEKEIYQAVKWARQAEFDNISLDLIFGVPNQTLESWQRSLSASADLGIEHLSLYHLTIEDHTPFKIRLEQGLMPRPDDDLAVDMYEFALDYLARENFQHYEISNWARQRSGAWKTCRHNLQYWHNQPYFGFGAGAHGFLFKKRTANVNGIGAYIDRSINGNVHFPASAAVETVIDISEKDEMQETMMMGLRLLREGVSRESFAKRFDRPIDTVFGAELSELARLNLIENGEIIRLTQRGMMIGNQVFMRFVGD